MSLSQEAERKLFSALGASVAAEVIPACNAALVGTSPAFSASTDATHLGFFGVTAAARASAYTLTYATTSRTQTAMTAAALTDSTGGSASGTLAAMTNLDTLTDSSGGVAATTIAAFRTDSLAHLAADSSAAVAQVVLELAIQKTLNAALVNAAASLASQVNKLVADLLVVKKVENAVVVDLQNYGLLQ